MRLIAEKRLGQVLLFVCPVTTLAISPYTNYDPINLIKGLVVSSAGFMALFLVLANLKYFRNRFTKKLNFAITLLVLGLLISLFFSSAPKNQQIWGMFGRANGLVTYLALISILVTAVVIRDASLYKRFIILLIGTTLVMNIYCYLQIFGKDPFPWSNYSPFGTLGNVNFLSSFLGISGISCLNYALDIKVKFSRKILLLLLILSSLFIIIKTDSIQGIMIFVAGFVVSCLVYTFLKVRKLFIPTVVISVASFIATVAALWNHGPLAKFIFQPSVTFRGDYMSAGIKMFVNNPLTGVGIDSYGDWYSFYRGVIATFRTGITRTSNTAHNIFIDVAAGSGIFAFLGYFLINVIVFSAAINFIKKSKQIDFIFLSIFTAWIAYFVQSLISINQLSLSVWGWALSGLIISYKPALEDASQLSKNPEVKSRKKQNQVLSASNNLVATFGFLIGLCAALVPFAADAQYRSAYSKGDLIKMMEASQSLGSNALLVGQTQIAATKSSYTEQAKGLNDFLISKFPRDFFAWQSRVVLPGVSQTDVNFAKLEVKKLDPYFFCYDNDPVAEIRDLLLSLPSNAQFELATSWGLAGNGVERDNFNFEKLPQDLFDKRLRQFCPL